MTLGVHPYHAAETYHTEGETCLDSFRALCNERRGEFPAASRLRRDRARPCL